MSDSRLVGSFGPERDLDEQQLAEMRPAIQSAPRPRKPRVPRELTSGIECFCGERFGEHQALEFMLHLRAEMGEYLRRVEHTRKYVREYQARRRTNDPEWRERRSAAIRARRANDPEWREHKNAEVREWHARKQADPEYRAQKNARNRERYAEQRADPEWRERNNARVRARRQVRMQDPEARARKNAQERERRARKKAEREAAP